VCGHSISNIIKKYNIPKFYFQSFILNIVWRVRP